MLELITILIHYLLKRFFLVNDTITDGFPFLLDDVEKTLRITMVGDKEGNC